MTENKNTDFNYEKARQEFYSEIGKVFVEFVPNEGLENKEKEAKDVAAFESYMDSDDFKIFDKEVSEL